MNQQIMPRATAPLAVAAGMAQQLERVADTFMKGAAPADIAFFGAVCQHTGLDPFKREIYAIKRWDGQLKREVWSFQISIDGFRLIAQRSGYYLGQDGPYWRGRADKTWDDIWLEEEPPAACKVGVYRAGAPAPIWGKVTYAEYVQRDRDGKPNSMWRKMPANQLAKCAESQALRKAFGLQLQIAQNIAPQYEITVGDSETDPDECPPERLQLAAPASSAQAGPRVADVVAARAAAYEAPGKSNTGPVAPPNNLDGATPRPGEPQAPSAAIDNPTEFWAAAQSLLDCPRGQVASQVLRYLGQEAAAYKQAHDLSWAALYAQLEAQVGAGRTTAPTARAAEAAAGEDDEFPDDAYDLAETMAVDAAV